MIAASLPDERAANAKVLAVDRSGRVRHWPRRDVARLFDAGDLVIANDAATIPASLAGRHLRSGRRIEARLAGRESLDVDRVTSFTAVVFGLGDFRMRTEDRPPPPQVEPGDRLAFGPLRASVKRLLFNHPRLAVIEFEGPPALIWEGLARHGKPIQYAHVAQPLMLWDTWTPIAGVPVAFEPPSASFALDWQTLASMRRRRVRFATITHAAGISSTGDPDLDALLPFDEPYGIPERTMWELQRARAEGRRIVAIGTTVVRALEHAAGPDGIVRAGDAHSDPTHRSVHAPPHRRRHSLGHSRAGLEPLCLTKCVCRRGDARPHRRGAERARVPHPRVRRFGVSRAHDVPIRAIHSVRGVNKLTFSSTPG